MWTPGEEDPYAMVAPGPSQQEPEDEQELLGWTLAVLVELEGDVER